MLCRREHTENTLIRRFRKGSERADAQKELSSEHVFSKNLPRGVLARELRSSHERRQSSPEVYLSNHWDALGRGREVHESLFRCILLRSRRIIWSTSTASRSLGCSSRYAAENSTNMDLSGKVGSTSISEMLQHVLLRDACLQLRPIVTTAY